MNKLYFFFVVLFYATIVNAQIKFSSDNDATFSSESVLIEFDDSDENVKGLILPSVNILNSNLVDGTLLFDAIEGAFKAKIDGNWKLMNDVKSNYRLAFENNLKDRTEGGVIIGDLEDERAVGALVLSSLDKAMVLPKIKSPHLNVGNPYEGMICYDKDSDMLAMFDGIEWNFWK